MHLLPCWTLDVQKRIRANDEPFSLWIGTSISILYRRLEPTPIGRGQAWQRLKQVCWIGAHVDETCTSTRMRIKRKYRLMSSVQCKDYSIGARSERVHIQTRSAKVSNYSKAKEVSTINYLQRKNQRSDWTDSIKQNKQQTCCYLAAITCYTREFAKVSVE